MRFRSTRGRGAAAGRIFGLATVAALVMLGASSAISAQVAVGPERGDRELPSAIQDLRLDTPVTLSASADLLGATIQGDGRVMITLSSESAAEAFAAGRNTAAAKQAAKAQQDVFLVRAKGIDSSLRELARVQAAVNAVFVQADASKLGELASDPAVERVSPIGTYELDLSDTVPYIGATAVHDKGFRGQGIKVAVLDSGIDYTHAALGGSGDPADYAANDPTVIEPGTFPTAKVKGGYDFVGSSWAGSSDTEAPDPDPLDDGANDSANQGVGHGTHVGHIIGGEDGVAPAVDLFAVKVCSTVSTSCSGMALVQGMDFALDPNGDGNLQDRVHVINMSLGSSYGQPFDDDLSAAVDNATGAGVLTVASAGNSADKPYATGTPSSTDSALSVAQTAVPSAVLQLLRVEPSTGGANEYPAVFQPWSAPLTSTISGPIQYGDGTGGELLGCSLGGDPNSVDPGNAPYAPGSLSGKIVLVDRGVCNFSIKIFNIQRGGGLAGVIGLVAPGDPFEGGFGAGGPFTIPGYMISQANANAIKAAIAGGGATGTLDPSNGIPLVGGMVGSSSRGPQHESTTRIKPEIGAPGASVSAVAGSGSGTEPFGGTSGAAPMVSGSAALVMQAFGGQQTTPGGRPPGNAFGHGLTPVEVKALLMNNAETDIVNDALTGALASITRIGGGEVRVNQAVAAPTAAWDDAVPTGALGFGFVDVADTVDLKKTVRIRNYDNKEHTYTITPTFRFANDEASGAVSVSAPANVVVKPGRGRDTMFEVTLTIDGSKLPGNFMNSGSQGANPAALTRNEYDGYLTLSEGSHTMHIPWHVLPRKAANVEPSQPGINGGAFPEVVGLNNTGVGTAQNDAYALIATSPDIPSGGRGEQAPTPDLRAVGINTFPVPAGFCSGSPSFLWVFSINTWERQEHLLPVSHQVILDTDQDGSADYVVLNRDLSGLNTITDGRQVTYAVDLAGETASIFFFAEHSTNTGNTVLVVCAEQIGMSAADMLATNVDVSVVAQDFYYGGPSDEIDGLTVTPLGERFVGVADDVPGNTNDADALEVFDFGAFPGNTPELGLMVVTNGDRGTGNRGGATKSTEALLLHLP